MKRGTVVILLQGPATEYAWLDALASEFGWSVEHAGGLGDLRNAAARGRLIAVLFDARAVDAAWNSALQAVQDAAPQALPILCHTSSDKIAWPELADAGAFHALLLPLHASEVRQSLGFVCAAQTRRQQARVIPMRRPAVTSVEESTPAAVSL